MPKKKKKTKTKKKKVTKKKNKKKIKKVTKKKTKKVFKKKNKSDEQTELIIKTRPEWVKTSLANKSTYLKKYNDSIKNNNEFGKKKEKE